MPSGKPECPECGHRFAPERRELEHVDGELVELQRQQAERRRQQAQAQTIKELVALGKARGMKNPYMWANHVLAARKAKAQAMEVA